MEDQVVQYSNVGDSTTPFLRQLAVCVTAWLSFFMFGMSMGTPTVTVPQLRKEANSTLAVTSEMASWLTSICGYSGSIWVLVITVIAHYIGRKKTVILLSFNTFTASVALYFSKNAVHVLISQSLHGLTTASQLTVLLMVITEYTSAKYRGLFLTLKSATFFWGIWTANAIGIFANYRYIGLVGIVCSTYNIITSFLIPESPYWLAFKGRYNECTNAHRWLKGVSASTERELEDLINFQKQRIALLKPKKTLRRYVRKYWKAIKQPEFYKPISIGLMVYLAYHMSGKFVYSVYAVEMMKKITSDESTAYTGVLVLDGFSVLGMYLGAGMSRFLKRRTLFLSSLSIGILFLFAVSLYLYLIKTLNVPDNPYIIIFLLVGFSLAICCGPMILTTSIASEVMPIKFRSFSIVVFGFIIKISLGIILKFSPLVFKYCGFDGTFFIFGIFSFIALILIYFLLPETKDKTLHDIAALFDSKKPQESNEASPMNKGF